jgi:transposase
MAQQPTIEAFQALEQELAVVRAERDLLQEQLNKFKRQLFAAKSEKAGAGPEGTQQKDLFFNEAEELGAAAQPAAEETPAGQEVVEVPAHQRAKAPKPGRKPLDPNLPREVVRHELPQAERVCPVDGTALQEIGVVTSEQMDIIPQQLRVIRHERVKYACPCCDGGLRLAAKPAQVIPKGLFSDGLLAWVITSKYMDGLPLYRQAVLLRRFGGSDLSRNTLAASVVRVGQAVQPVINLLRDRLLEAPLIYGDETEIQVLKEPGRRAQTKSYMWAQMCEKSGADSTGPPIRLFAYTPSRATEAALRLYAGAGPGALMTDGYEPYSQVAKTNQLVHLACWAHCRRYFFDAMQALPKDKRGPEQLAVRFIELIGKLYKVESQAKDEGLDTQALTLRRQQQSAPLMEQIKQLLLTNLHVVAPKTLLGKALHYAHGQWPKLECYVQNGNYPIDNNPCENSIRPFVIGRRNWLFADTVAGANASANLYSLLQTCKANGIDGYAYLRKLLGELPKASTVEDFEALLPWAIGISKN